MGSAEKPLKRVILSTLWISFTFVGFIWLIIMGKPCYEMAAFERLIILRQSAPLVS